MIRLVLNLQDAEEHIRAASVNAHPARRIISGIRFNKQFFRRSEFSLGGNMRPECFPRDVTVDTDPIWFHEGGACSKLSQMRPAPKGRNS